MSHAQCLFCDLHIDTDSLVCMVLKTRIAAKPRGWSRKVIESVFRQFRHFIIGRMSRKSSTNHVKVMLDAEDHL